MDADGGAVAVDHLRAAVEQLPIGVVLADAGGRLTYANAAARQLLPDLATGAALGGPVLGRVRRADGEPIAPDELPLPRALRGERVVGSIWRLALADGEQAQLRATAAPVRAEDGRLLGAVLALHDVTADR